MASCTYIKYTIVSLEIWHSNSMNRCLFLLKAKKPSLKFVFEITFATCLFGQNASISSWTCWWWLPSGLVSQPFANTQSPISWKKIILRKMFSFYSKISFWKFKAQNLLCQTFKQTTGAVPRKTKQRRAKNLPTTSFCCSNATIDSGC